MSLQYGNIELRNNFKKLIAKKLPGVKLFLSDKGNVLTRFHDHPELDSLRIQSITLDSDNLIWISTFGSGVIQLNLSEDRESIKSERIFNDKTGLNIGDGISVLTSYAFSYVVPGKNSGENNILYVNSYKDKYILGTPTGFHLYNPVSGKSDLFTDLTGKVGKAEITSYYLDQDENLWIGTGGERFVCQKQIRISQIVL